MQFKGIIPQRLLGFFITLLGFCAANAQQITVYSNGNVTVGTTRQLTAYVP